VRVPSQSIALRQRSPPHRISDTNNNRIVLLTANGSWVMSVVTSGLASPLQLTFLGDVLYFGDGLNYRVSAATVERGGGTMGNADQYVHLMCNASVPAIVARSTFTTPPLPSLLADEAAVAQRYH